MYGSGGWGTFIFFHLFRQSGASERLCFAAGSLHKTHS